MAQLAGVVEYTDCISADGVRRPSKSVLDRILNNLILRIAIALWFTVAQSDSTW